MQSALPVAIAVVTEVTLRPEDADKVMNAAKLAVYVETTMSMVKATRIWNTMDAVDRGCSKPPHLWRAVGWGSQAIWGLMWQAL